MPNALMASGLQMPQIDATGEFAKGQNTAQTGQINAMNIDNAKQQQYMQGLNTIAAGAAYATDPKTGQVDPTKWNEVVDTVAKSGADVSQFKDHPYLAPMLIKLSLTTQQQIANAQNQSQIDMAIKDYQFKVQQYMHPLPVKMGPGDRLADPRDNTTVGADPSAGGFFGTSTEQQALKIVADGTKTGKTDTYEYAQAHNFLSQPVTTTVPDGHGGMTQVTTPRTLPPGTLPPTYKGTVPIATPDAGAPPPAAAPPPPAGGLGATGQVNAGGTQLTPPPAMGLPAPSGQTTAPNGTTVTPIPGLKAPGTEATIRTGLLSGNLNTVAPSVLKGYETLADPTQQGIKALTALPVIGPLMNIFQSDEYQTADTGIDSAIQAIVFDLSGSNTAPNEKATTAASMTPVVGDKPGVLKLKKQIFMDFVKNIAEASQDPVKKAEAQQILDAATASTDTGTTSAPPNVVDWTTYFKSSLPTQ